LVRAQISAEGRFEELVALSGRLGASHGLLPESLHWRPTDRGAILEMTAPVPGPRAMSGRGALRALVLVAASLLLAFQMSRQSGRALSPRVPEPVRTTAPVAAPTEDPEPARRSCATPSDSASAPTPRSWCREPGRRSSPSARPRRRHPRSDSSAWWRRGGVLNAAIAVGGEVALAAVGESAFGYSVRAIDEDAGVRVQTPDGAEILIALAPEP
jgi:hypothetical protein